MNDDSHEELRPWLGAYLLGHLSAGEQERVEAHLETCDLCTAELGELTPVADGLARLRRAGRVDDAPPADLGDRVVTAVLAEDELARRRAGRRTSRRVAVAAVAAAMVGVVGGLGLAQLRPDPAPPTVPLEAVQVSSTDPAVAASADLVDHTWGVEVKLTASGFDRGAAYRVAFLGVDGQRYPAGGFVGTGSREMLCNLNAWVLRDRTTGFEVRDSGGDVVLSSSF